MQYIEIKNLGPVSDFKMDIKNFNFLIGEQATGKSTISKAVYFFHAIKEMIVDHLCIYATDENYAKDFKFPSALNRRSKSLFIELFGYSWNLNENLFMKYQFTDDIDLSVCLNCGKNKKRFVSIQYSKNLFKQVKEIEGMLKIKESNFNDFDFSFLSNERVRIREEITQKINVMFEDSFECFYIPAGRQLLTLLVSQKTKLDYDSIDYVNRIFMQFNESIQSRFENGILKANEYYPMAKKRFDVDRMAKNIINDLKGDYRLFNQHEYFILKNGERIPINFASSGQQEALWLYMQLYTFMLRGKNAFVIIEEPEAHLYPSLQKNIVEFIVQFVNMGNNRVIVTTHSPYILTAVNALYYGGKVGKKYSEKVNKIINKVKWIDPDNFAAYKLLNKEGKTEIENIVDHELEELKTSKIDEISNEINELYSELYYLEIDDANT